MPKISTFSIVAFDSSEPAWGIAVASKFPAVGAVVPWAKAGVGAVATQSHANTTYGPLGLAMLAEGRSAQETMEQLLQADPDRALRQAGIVDTRGEAETFTGEDCIDWAGGKIGAGYCLQGNILAGAYVLDEMEEVFLSTKGDLPTRLLASLMAGDRAGGDRRGRQSAALFVVKPEGGYGGYNDRWIDYRVDDHPDPVPRLSELLQLYYLYFGKSSEEDEIQVEGEVCQTLQRMMAKHGYYEGPVDGVYDEKTQKALRHFIGNENFEDRTDFGAGMIDRPVLDYLKKKFGD